MTLTAEQTVDMLASKTATSNAAADPSWWRGYTYAQTELLGVLREAGYNLDGPDIGQMLDDLLAANRNVVQIIEDAPSEWKVWGSGPVTLSVGCPSWREAVAAAWTALQEAEESAPAEREPEPERPTVPDLVAALQASLDRAKPAQKAEKPQ